MKKDKVYDVFTPLLAHNDTLSMTTLLAELFSGDCDEAYAEVQLAKSEFGYKIIEGDFGGEGEGEDCYSVINFDGKFYRASWNYYSYNGCDYDNIENTVREVTPQQRTITVYN